MNTQLLKDSVVWGAVLWFIGYVLGFIFFAFIPTSVIGWYIMPFGIALTVWILMKYIKGDTLSYYLTLGIVWTFIAIILDYVFLVQLLKPADGYYKLDVYLYYLFTFSLPLIVYLLTKREWPHQ